jgi:hypothetical protein
MGGGALGGTRRRRPSAAARLGLAALGFPSASSSSAAAAAGAAAAVGEELLLAAAAGGKDGSMGVPGVGVDPLAAFHMLPGGVGSRHHPYAHALGLGIGMAHLLPRPGERRGTAQQPDRAPPEQVRWVM